MRMSTQAHVRAEPLGEVDGLAAVGGLADDVDAVASRIMRMPERTISWSSAMTTRNGVHDGRRPANRDRQVGGDLPAAGGERSGVELAAERRDPLGHAEEAEAAAASG